MIFFPKSVIACALLPIYGSDLQLVSEMSGARFFTPRDRAPDDTDKAKPMPLKKTKQTQMEYMPLLEKPLELIGKEVNVPGSFWEALGFIVCAATRDRRRSAPALSAVGKCPPGRWLRRPPVALTYRNSAEVA